MPVIDVTLEERISRLQDLCDIDQLDLTLNYDVQNGIWVGWFGDEVDEGVEAETLQELLEELEEKLEEME
jgi:hypothetical protein